MKNIQQGNTMVDRMIMVAFIGLIVLEFFVEQPISQISLATGFLTDFL
jgi:hypothetical protein